MVTRCKSFYSTLYIISLRVEVSLFVLSPEIEDGNAVVVDNWAKHKKRASTLNDIYYFIFKGITNKKSDMTS
jgi:hypothetical protein